MSNLSPSLHHSNTPTLRSHLKLKHFDKDHLFLVHRTVNFVGQSVRLNAVNSFSSTLQVTAGLGPSHHSALKIAYPRVSHVCQFLSSNISHGPHHTVNDYLGIFIRGQVFYVALDFIVRHQQVRLGYFAIIRNMNVDENEIRFTCF